jgi:hypothetical protein
MLSTLKPILLALTLLAPQQPRAPQASQRTCIGWPMKWRPCRSSSIQLTTFRRQSTRPAPFYLVAGGVYPGSITLHSNTTLDCKGASLTGSALAPTIVVEVGAQNVVINNCTVTSSGFDQQVIRIGRNDSGQTQLAQAPAHIALRHVTIPTFRGKHAIEVNGSDVWITDTTVLDAYDLPTASRDSQAIWIGNAPCQPCVIDHNTLSAGSENILVGGDLMKIPGVYPTDIRITYNRIFKPLVWQTDGINRAVKNLIELKTGRQVLIKGNVLDGSWHAAQDGYAFAITPRSGGDIQNVLVEDNTVTNVAGGFNILGRDDGTGSLIPTPAPISNLVIRRLSLSASSKLYGGRGILALITGAPHDVTFDNVTGVYDGNSIIQLDTRSVTNPDGTISYVRMAALTITNSRLTSGVYGLFLRGNVGGKNWPSFIDALTVTGNTLVDPSSGDARSAMHTLFPTNTYVDRPTFDALLAVQ